MLVNEARCVHRLAAVATCSRCVSACPTGAWQMQRDGLSFDADLCDDCALCVPACPTDALTRSDDRSIKAGTAMRPPIMALACRKAVDDPSDGQVWPCLHAIGEAQLLHWHDQGTRTLRLTPGNCSSCARGRGTALAQRIEAINRVFASSAKPPLVIEYRTRYEPPSAFEGAARVSAQASPVQASRRGFFASLRGPASARQGACGPVAPPRGRRQVVQWQQDHPSAELLWGVRLDERACTACLSCARLCPTGAIRLHEGALCLNMSHCVGCGLCIDLCAADAIQNLTQPRAGTTRLALERSHCRACGIIHHELKNSTPAGLCPVCVGGAARGPDRRVQQDAG